MHILHMEPTQATELVKLEISVAVLLVDELEQRHERVVLLTVTAVALHRVGIVERI